MAELTREEILENFYLSPLEFMPQGPRFTLDQVKEIMLHAWNYGDGTTSVHPYVWFKERFKIDINGRTEDIDHTDTSLQREGESRDSEAV